ncbi:hypothetical protein ES695_13780 [Candidatus Atribacteria bacterium 1244-E10-H5-B2]|nr:MAG: hypothetical protein ES695_13780 [Candidatus Atribacteria bacterium 1244-E10-H5-B2]
MEFNKRLLKILDKEILTEKEFEFVEEHEDVKSVENYGRSGRYPKKYVYDVTLINGKRYDIYLKGENING